MAALTRNLALLVAIATVACLNPTSPDAVVGKPFELNAGATALLSDGARIQFTTVSGDSRCPMDAQCVWAGDATVAIAVSQSGKPADACELHTQQSGSQISCGDYVITLRALAPYPRSGKTIAAQDYVATFLVQ